MHNCSMSFNTQSHYNINISLTVDVVRCMFIFESMEIAKSIIILKSQSFVSKPCAVAICG